MTSLRCNFNPLPSHEGRRSRPYPGFRARQISIHSPHTRGDYASEGRKPALTIFQSTPLTRGETKARRTLATKARHFNPLPSHEGRLMAMMAYAYRGISIHSPHTRGDMAVRRKRMDVRISIHSPHTRGDVQALVWIVTVKKFQSTPLTRGETRSRSRRSLVRRISIHSPHTRGDVFNPRNYGAEDNFNPLPSHEGRQFVDNMGR